MKTKASLRALPAVETVLQALQPGDVPRRAVVAVVRRELAIFRKGKTIPAPGIIVAHIQRAIEELRRSRLQAVINGTGVLLHTNLGRAPMGKAVEQAVLSILANYTNLEIDLTTGERGGRATYLEHNLALLCGAQGAMVVNNCAAAYVLVLRHLTSLERPEVIVSRGELPQIGGGFRIPEILEASGAKLREVGTTNKTLLKDYAEAIGPRTALILRVHHSNFFMEGFVAAPTTAEISALAKRKRLPFVQGLGSGAMVETAQFAGVEHEPTPAEVLREGCDLVCFSGDKLMGGPQAGIIVGQRRFISALKREPFFRALRCDKLILAALQTTIDLYLGGQGHARGLGVDEIPLLSQLQLSRKELHERAENIVSALADSPLAARIGEGDSQVGGGSLPRSVIPSVTLELTPKKFSAARLAEKLRCGTPPVIGYLSGGQFKLDLRTVFSRQDQALVGAIRAAL